MAVWQADTYRLYQYSGQSNGIKYVIRLEEAGGGPHALHAYFTNSTPLPSNNIAGNFYALFYPDDMFAPMMEMLREEKPIYVHEYGLLNIYIGTHAEPIGEDEGP